MSKKTVFTTITPLPAGVSRETVLSTLHDHLEMIDLNPSHEERHMTKPPPEASPEEYHCQWYAITDKVSYFPGIKGSVSFKACFHDLAAGVQIHVYAPMGLDIKEKWSLGGNAPGEKVQVPEIGIGAPVSGLYLREDVEMRCSFLMTKFVRKTLKEALATLVARLVVKSQLQEAVAANNRLTYGFDSPFSQHSTPQIAELQSPQTGFEKSPEMRTPSPFGSPKRIGSSPMSPGQSMSLMSQAMRSSLAQQGGQGQQIPGPIYIQQPNSAPLQQGQRPEWAPSPALGGKHQRTSLPPLPGYNPQDYAPQMQQMHQMHQAHQVQEMEANQAYAMQLREWQMRQHQQQQQYGPPSGYAELQ